MTVRRVLGPGPDPADRAAVVAAVSRYVRHGEAVIGGSFRTCTCRKEACGGVTPDSYRDDCPEHGGGRTPVQRWHWAAQCPGQTCPECRAPYVAGAGQGHQETCSEF